MSKSNLKRELEKQLQKSKLNKWCSVAIAIIGLLLCFTIIGIIIGLPMFIIGWIGGNGADKKISQLKIELAR